ncbi:unnamed protein product [Chondrus crispus]|uniref:Uncharacterized protein n=1 Tax=Chondrus crispus TaxID=2769 RepID=R7Q949_CHOCR|nr:unnamed protein product [Chondrus crispus]CDF34338.1 unnamed protein product [Chondrus crispus]|eukprot:XP_005714157.1 unnamed protein product [Chondrus crispus]
MATQGIDEKQRGKVLFNVASHTKALLYCTVNNIVASTLGYGVQTLPYSTVQKYLSDKLYSPVLKRVVQGCGATVEGKRWA